MGVINFDENEIVSQIIDETTKQVIENIDYSDLAEKAIENIDMDDFASDLSYYIDLERLAERVMSNMDIDSEINDYIDSNNFMTSDGLQDELLELAESFNPEHLCHLGKAVNKIVNRSVFMLFRQLNDAINSTISEIPQQFILDEIEAPIDETNAFIENFKSLVGRVVDDKSIQSLSIDRDIVNNSNNVVYHFNFDQIEKIVTNFNFIADSDHYTVNQDGTLDLRALSFKGKSVLRYIIEKVIANKLQ